MADREAPKVVSAIERLVGCQREVAVLRSWQQEARDRQGRKGPLPSSKKLLEHLELGKGQLLGDDWKTKRACLNMKAGCPTFQIHDLQKRCCFIEA
jgi:hypothetical protein